MKKKLIYLSLLVTIGILGACQKEEVPFYDDSVAKNSIYFPLAHTINNIGVSFGYSKNDVLDSTVRIVVRTIGSPVNNDRAYNLSIADSSTMKAGVDYEILNDLVIKSGKVADTLQIKFLRTQKIKKDSVFLYLDLKPNENFTNNFLSRDTTVGGKTITKYYTRLKVKLDDIAGPPPFWTAGNSYYSYTIGYLGSYSTAKFQLLMTRYNLDVNELIQPNWFLNNGNYRRLSPWSDGLKAYFLFMSNAKTPVYEADGTTLMTMGPNAR